MEEFLILAAYCMLILGPIQFFWALVGIFTTKDKMRCYHWGKYLIGVCLYFLAMIPLVLFAENEVIRVILGVHFYGSAFALCAYHVRIVRMGDREDSRILRAHPNADLG